MYENNKVIYNLERCEKLEKLFIYLNLIHIKNFKLASKKNCNNSLQTYTYNMNIHNISLVNTIECISLEDERLTGKKLILVGDINTDVTLDYADNKKK